MPVTIKDIARIADVSHSTVSRALTGHEGIPLETAGRIKKIASDLGYIPSAVARGLKTNRSQALGVIVSRIDDPFFSEILQGIEELFQGVGYSLFVAASNHDKVREKDIARSMVQHRIDGLIICSTHFRADHYNLMRQYGFPIVVVGNHEIADYQHMVYHDDFFGSCQVARYLIELGHRKIGFIGNRKMERTTQGRLDGFAHEMSAARLPIRKEWIFHSSSDQIEGGVIGTRHFMSLADRPSAIICFNDMMAIGVLRALHEQDVSVPADCSVVGFDDIIFAAYTQPTLTTFAQPKYQLGHEAAKMMYALIQSPAGEAKEMNQTRMLRGKLIVRESSAEQKTR